MSFEHSLLCRAQIRTAVWIHWRVRLFYSRKGLASETLPPAPWSAPAGGTGVFLSQGYFFLMESWRPFSRLPSTEPLQKTVKDEGWLHVQLKATEHAASPNTSTCRVSSYKSIWQVVKGKDEAETYRRETIWKMGISVYAPPKLNPNKQYLCNIVNTVVSAFQTHSKEGIKTQKQLNGYLR